MQKNELKYQTTHISPKKKFALLVMLHVFTHATPILAARAEHMLIAHENEIPSLINRLKIEQMPRISDQSAICILSENGICQTKPLSTVVAGHLIINPNVSREEVDTICTSLCQLQRYIAWDRLLTLIAIWIAHASETAVKEEQEYLCKAITKTLPQLKLKDKLDGYAKRCLSDALLSTWHEQLAYKNYKATEVEISAIHTLHLNLFLTNLLKNKRSNSIIEMLEAAPYLFNQILYCLILRLISAGATVHEPPIVLLKRSRHLEKYFSAHIAQETPSSQTILCQLAVNAGKRKNIEAKKMWNNALQFLREQVKARSDLGSDQNKQPNSYMRYKAKLKQKKHA